MHSESVFGLVLSIIVTWFTAIQNGTVRSSTQSNFTIQWNIDLVLNGLKGLRMQVCLPFSEILTNPPWQTSSRRAWNSVSAAIMDPKFGSEVMFGKSTVTGWAHRDLQFWTRTMVRDGIIKWKLLAVGSGLTSNFNKSKMVCNPNTIPDTGFSSQKQILMQSQCCASLWSLKKKEKEKKFTMWKMWVQISGLLRAFL